MLLYSLIWPITSKLVASSWVRLRKFQLPSPESLLNFTQNATETTFLHVMKFVLVVPHTQWIASMSAWWKTHRGILSSRAKFSWLSLWIRDYDNRSFILVITKFETSVTTHTIGEGKDYQRNPQKHLYQLRRNLAMDETSLSLVGMTSLYRPQSEKLLKLSSELCIWCRHSDAWIFHSWKSGTLEFDPCTNTCIFGTSTFSNCISASNVNMPLICSRQVVSFC
jgi:hypothetical protein